MKKLLALATLAGFSLTALAFPYTYKYEMGTCPSGSASTQCAAAQTCSAGTCNGTAPTTSSEGMTLAGVSQYRVTICAASGQTLSGAGTMQSFTFSTAEGVWARGSSDGSVSNSGVRCQSFDFQVGLRYDRVRYVASGVTVSGGAALDVMLEGQGQVR